MKYRSYFYVPIETQWLPEAGVEATSSSSQFWISKPVSSLPRKA